MEMNKAMKMFVKNEVAFASAKWIHQAMSVFQIEHKEKTIHYFLDELNEGIADERVHYIQIALLRYKTLQKKTFLSDTNLWLCLLSCFSTVRKGIEMGLAV